MQSHTFLLSALSLTLITPCVSAHTSNEVRATTPVAASAPTVVPALIPYASVAAAVDGKPLAGDSSMTFLIFKDEAGGQPLWVETQIVSPDSTGQYAVKLGAASPSGVPLEIFATGTARWLEVQIAGQRPQPRVLLATVPYAARAADAAHAWWAACFCLCAGKQPGGRACTRRALRRHSRCDCECHHHRRQNPLPSHLHWRQHCSRLRGL